MTESPSAAAQRLLVQAADALLDAASSSSDAELVALLSTCESVVRRLDRATVDAVAALDRRGVFAEHGYRSAVQALSDLLGWERFEARRRVTAAEQVTPRTGLDGSVLPARLPATAEVFAAGRTGLRHVEVIARVLASRPAGRLSPEPGRVRRRSWPARPTCTPRTSCSSGARRWSSCWIRTVSSPTTGPRPG